MLEVAALLCLYAAMVAAYFRAPDRWPRGTAPEPVRLRWIDAGLAVLLVWALFLTLIADGAAAGLGLWCAALMVAGVAAVSMAGFRPLAARRSGMAAAAVGAAVLPIAVLAGV